MLSIHPKNASANNPPGVMTHDDELGMAWWNALSERQRAKWSATAGNTGRVKDAWEAFKRGSVDQTPPVDTTRRHFLLAVGGGTAAMLAATIPEPATTAPAGPLDPGVSIIEAHREASARHVAALRE